MIEPVLWLMFSQGCLGAFDTIYYHELKAKLPGLGAKAAPELRLHASRDFIYAILFGSLPWVSWGGYLVVPLSILIVAEIVITLRDFMVEDAVRKPIGGVFPGERATHAVMGIIYGAMLSHLLPLLLKWYQSPTAFIPSDPHVPLFVRLLMVAMTGGLLASGLRDLFSSYDLPYSSWPWRNENAGPWEG